MPTEPTPEPREAAKKKAVLIRRIGFGALLLAISCGLLWLDHATRTSYGIAAMVAYSVVFGLKEMHRMLEAIQPVPWRGPQRIAGFLVVAAQLYQHEMLHGRRFPIDLGDAVIAGWLVIFLAGQLAHTPTRERLTGIALHVFSWAYIAYLGSFVLRCRYLADADPVLPRNIGYAAILYLVLVAKGTDMFAFFTGRFLGKRKMIPWISPGKTWAGGVGGLLGAVAITAAFVKWSSLGPVYGWGAVVPVGLLMGAISSAGDLVESLVKRGSAVKDSGGLVPEFGGVLDIIDCILFAAPTIYLSVLVLR